MPRPSATGRGWRRTACVLRRVTTTGAMACRRVPDRDRMAEPEAIFAAAMAMLEVSAPIARDRALAGKHVLITAGPTEEPIDPVRVLTNRSSGKQGYAIACALACARRAGDAGLRPGRARDAARRDAQVDVETAVQMLWRPARRRCRPTRAAVCVAAVADWRIDEAFAVKLKKSRGTGRRPCVWSRSRTSWRPSPVWPSPAEAGGRLRRRNQRPRGAGPSQGCSARAATGSSPTTSAPTAGSWAATRTRCCWSIRRVTDRWPRASKAAEVARRLAERDRRGSSRVTPEIAVSGAAARTRPAVAGLRDRAQAAGMDLRAALPEDALLTPAPRRPPPGARPASPSRSPPASRSRCGRDPGPALRHGVTCLNSPGTVDADYRGEVMVILINHGPENFVVRRGERIAQLLISPVVQATWREVEALGETVRGAGGFGSTGRG